MKIRLFIICYTLLSIVCYTFTAASAKTGLEEYSDMPVGWSRIAMEYAIEKGLFYGTNGKLMPKAKLTRAQLAAVVNRLVKAKVKADISNITDVTQDDWFYEDMAKAVNLGFFDVNGNKLHPNEYTTREEVFVVMAMALGIPPLKNTLVLNKFDDNDLVADDARGRIAAMVQKGYMLSSNNKIEPIMSITREEFAHVILVTVQGEDYYTDE